jgi:hypothetical protein
MMDARSEVGSVERRDHNIWLSGPTTIRRRRIARVVIVLVVILASVEVYARHATSLRSQCILIQTVTDEQHTGGHSFQALGQWAVGSGQ